MELNRPTLYDIACRFSVSHIASALIPATRLSKILDGMFHGRPLTEMSLTYLQELNLSELHQLASGQITYEAFITALDPELIAREDTAKAKHQGLELVRLAQEAKWALEAERKSEAEKAARIRETARHDAAKAARISIVKERAAQCKRNREAAEAAYKAGMSEPDYVAPTPNDIARHYRINHLPSAITSPLSNILSALYQGRPLSEAYLNYLKIKGLPRLYELAIGQATYESYISDINAVEAARTARFEQVEAQRLQREAAEIARIARESDPEYILRKKYGVLAIDQSSLPRLMDILKNIDTGNRLGDDNFLWLKTEAEQYFTCELRKAYHLREAEFCANEYRRTQDPWGAINASGHYRKCKQPESALELLVSVPAKLFKLPKIHSAICTTHGGVMRDLGRGNEAFQLGKQGHELQPQNFRPCTLLGALSMEIGNFEEGHDWYTKAEERGASKQSIDIELKAIFLRADKVMRETMRASLLVNDPNRYCWAKEKSK